MAGYVSKAAAERWNNTARIVAGGGAGTRHVPGMYREPKTGGGCTSVPQPGSYPATAGAAIAAGATGNVVYDGTIYSAVNQSQCLVTLGQRVGLHVSPSCEAFFVPCVCSCEPTCCDKYAAVCLCEQSFVLAMNGGTQEVVLTECSDCEGATLTLTFECVGGLASMDWVYECGEDTDSGTITGIEAICDDSEHVVIDSFIDSTYGFFPIKFSNQVFTACDGPSTTPACWCASQSVNCTLNGVLFDVTGLAANAPFDCGCVDINGKYFASYPDDAVTNTCNQITLERQIPFDCPSGGTATLVLRWDMQCSSTNLNIRMTAVLSVSGSNLPAIADSGTVAEAIATFPCVGYELTDAGPGVVSPTDRCDATGASVTARIV